MVYSCNMTSREQIEAFRRMLPADRWKLQVELMDAAWEDLEKLPVEELRRRMEYLRLSHEEGNRRIAERFRSLQASRHVASAHPDPA